MGSFIPFVFVSITQILRCDLNWTISDLVPRRHRMSVHSRERSVSHSRDDLSEDELPVEVPDEEVNLKDINSGYLVKIAQSRFGRKVGRSD